MVQAVRRCGCLKTLFTVGPAVRVDRLLRVVEHRVAVLARARVQPVGAVTGAPGPVRSTTDVEHPPVTEAPGVHVARTAPAPSPVAGHVRLSPARGKVRLERFDLPDGQGQQDLVAQHAVRTVTGLVVRVTFERVRGHVPD